MFWLRATMMTNPMGESGDRPVRLDFDHRLKLDFYVCGVPIGKDPEFNAQGRLESAMAPAVQKTILSDYPHDDRVESEPSQGRP
jgi:hypothetical protein